ncbi:RNA polymerase sigma factor [Mucilaginibacter myungsuensis]|nr:sigma-70 family RNA polymerase sigma factor [Mucilaginibacter myungsuensis]MDN3598027.1 sigma-70 family RNA polymerase sigma factor [Mucilaginibacter myungsuensis]
MQNNRASQEALYKLFYSDMLRVCHSYLADPALAKEAFNTGFLKVFQSIKNFDIDKGELGGWIRKIMVFSAIDLCRKELRFNNTNTIAADTDDEFIPPRILEKLYFDEILKQIRTLPAAAQMVFNLSVLDDLSHKEIGEQLSISEGTSRWHLAEAKKRLRELLDPGNQQTKERRSNGL